MDTGFVDVDGKPINEDDILESTDEPARRGTVVKSGSLFVVACSTDQGLMPYRLDGAYEWRIVERDGE